MWLKTFVLWLMPAAFAVAWPEVKPINENVFISDVREGVLIEIPITNIEGNLLYTFMCRGGTADYLDRVSSKITWVEPFGCRLYEGGIEVESSLLGHDESPPWHTRGQIKSWEELKRLDSRLRMFRLRGMRLIMKFSNVTDSGFSLNVRVQSDKTATTELAASDETNYCRSEEEWNFGSWEACK